MDDLNLLGVGAGVCTDVVLDSDTVFAGDLDGVSLGGPQLASPLVIPRPYRHLRPHPSSSTAIGTHASPSCPRARSSSSSYGPNVSSGSSWASSLDELPPLARFALETHRHERIALAIQAGSQPAPLAYTMLSSTVDNIVSQLSPIPCESPRVDVGDPSQHQGDSQLLRYCADCQTHELLAVQLQDVGSQQGPLAPQTSHSTPTDASPPISPQQFGEIMEVDTLSSLSFSSHASQAGSGDGPSLVRKRKHDDMLLEIKETIRAARAARYGRGPRTLKAISVRKDPNKRRRLALAPLALNSLPTSTTSQQ